MVLIAEPDRPYWSVGIFDAKKSCFKALEGQKDNFFRSELLSDDLKTAVIAILAVLAARKKAPVNRADNQHREACQTAAGAIWETWHWRNVRTAQDSVGGNTSPP